MDNNYIDRHEFEQYSKRMEDEHSRQNHRIADLEKFSEQNNQLLVTINKLATSMENMQREMNNLGGRMETIENRDGEKWRKLISHGLTVVVTILVTYALREIGIG